MTEKETLKELALDEYMRLWNKYFGLSGNCGDCRATAAYIAKKFGLERSYIIHAADTAIEAYKEGFKFAFLTGEGRVWLEKGIALVEPLLNQGEEDSARIKIL